MSEQYHLGEIVKDIDTGFTGRATAYTVYVNGCVRIQVEPQELRDGKPVEGIWFDAQRIDAAIPVKTGGPGPVPPNRDAPKR